MPSFINDPTTVPSCAYCFNSLFEMPQTRNSDGAVRDERSFNSLFEMQNKTAAASAVARVSFNSLFEMRYTGGMITAAVKVEFQFSI